MAGQTLLELIERMTVSKELTPDKAEEIARTLPIIAINAPRIISELKSAGVPDPEDATWKIVKLLNVVSTVYSQNMVSEAINKLAEKKRNSAHASNQRKSKYSAERDALEKLLESNP